MRPLDDLDRPTSLQEAWRALIGGAPVEALQRALSTQLLDGFFQLGGAPAGQALPLQLLLTPENNEQVAACTELKASA